MKALNFLRYFLFLAINWNLRIAFYIIYHEIKGERKYGINTTGINSLQSLKKRGIDISHATIYMPIVYPLLEVAFGQITVERNHFLDIGCGKGRALCIASHMGFKKISGIDFSELLCKVANENIRKTQSLDRSLLTEIIHKDILDYIIPDDIDCIFFFNPFDEMIMKVVLKNILESINKNKRMMQIIYANPIHKELFIRAGFSEIFYIKRLTYLELSILKTAIF